MVVPVVMYGYESWTIKKAERWRIDAFELRCLRRFLRVHWITRRSNQSILREISPGYFLEGLMLKLKLQYFGHLMRRADSLERPWCWERLKAGREGDDRGWDGWMASLTRCTWVWISSGSWWWTGRPVVLRSMGLQRVGHDWITEQNWWLGGKVSTCQCRRHGCSPWVGKIPWRRKWQFTLVFLPGKSCGQKSLACCSPWGSKRVRHDLVTK